jgi:hypothetical protein
MATLNRPSILRTKTGRISKALKGLKVHECSQCGKVFHFQNGSSSSSILILTIDRRTTELSISGSPAFASTPSCSQLDIGLLTIRRRHQYNHQGSPQLCKVCNKAFYRSDLLARHLLNQ